MRALTQENVAEGARSDLSAEAVLVAHTELHGASRAPGCAGLPVPSSRSSSLGYEPFEFQTKPHIRSTAFSSEAVSGEADSEQLTVAVPVQGARNGSSQATGPCWPT